MRHGKLLPQKEGLHSKTLTFTNSLRVSSRICFLPGKNAYVTLLYNDFVEGVRVLGQSLRETKTQMDMVVLATESVGENTRNVLRRDGWIVKPVSALDNPNSGFAERLGSVYTKLMIFSLTDYDKIVFLGRLCLARIIYMQI